LLLVATFLGNGIAVRQLLEILGSEEGHNMSAALRETDSEGNTALMIAARLGYDDIICALIPHISQFHVRGTQNTSGESALHLAMYSGKESTVRLLAEWLPDALRAVDSKWRTPLAVAVQVQTAGVVEYLLDKESNIATRDSEHRTLLHHAVDRGSEQIVRLLLDRKCPRTTDRSGETAFTRAARKGNAGIVRLFLEYGESTEHRDGKGHTILMNAVLAGTLEVVKVIVAAGPDLEASSAGGSMKGATALVMAQKNKHSNIAEFLVRSGANCTVM
jgi:ankyrin repeat protein